MSGGTAVAAHAELSQLAEAIAAEHEAAEHAIGQALQHARRAGELLLQAREQIPHGEYLDWLREHCRIAPRTAQTYARIARRWPEITAAADASGRTQIGIHDARRLLADVDREREARALVEELVRLVPEAKLSPVNLDLPPGLPFETWQQVGAILERLRTLFAGGEGEE